MLKREFLTPQFLRFLVSGGIAALANFGSRILYEQTLPIGYGSAIVLAHLTGMVVAFILFRLHVFDKSSLHPAQEIARFILINLLAVLQTLLVSLLLAEYLLPAMGVEWMRKEMAHAAGIIVPIFTSFIGHKYFSFEPGKTGPSQ